LPSLKCGVERVSWKGYEELVESIDGDDVVDVIFDLLNKG
jgi:hypothetical protein